MFKGNYFLASEFGTADNAEHDPKESFVDAWLGPELVLVKPPDALDH